MLTLLLLLTSLIAQQHTPDACLLGATATLLNLAYEERLYTSEGLGQLYQDKYHSTDWQWYPNRVFGLVDYPKVGGMLKDQEDLSRLLLQKIPVMVFMREWFSTNGTEGKTHAVVAISIDYGDPDYPAGKVTLADPQTGGTFDTNLDYLFGQLESHKWFVHLVKS